MSEPTPMPEWLERQFDNVERTVAEWSDGKCEAAGIPRPKPPAPSAMTIISDIQSWQARTFFGLPPSAATMKVEEEYKEWQAVDAYHPDDRNETGDLLVATIGYARVMGWDVEQLLRDTLAKCEAREYVDGERVK